MARFTVALRWTVGEEDRETGLIVSGQYDFSPGNKRGHPDSWTPPWSELDVESVEYADGDGLLKGWEVGELCADDSFLRAVEQEILSS